MSAEEAGGNEDVFCMPELLPRHMRLGSAHYRWALEGRGTTGQLQQQAEPRCHSLSRVHWVEDKDSHGQAKEGAELDPASL